ncbi:MAG: YbhN family protein [Actinobacteria bacterium]|nr:YbhN family protein [Actinomycetota bacterium]
MPSSGYGPSLVVVMCNDSQMGPNGPGESKATQSPEDGHIPDVGDKAARRSFVQRLLHRPIRHAIFLFLIILIVEYAVVPDLVVAKRSFVLLGRVNIFWLLGGLILEAASLAAYVKLTQEVLPAGGPGYGQLTRIDLSTLAVSHVVPGGTAAGSALGYRLLTSSGVSGADTGFALGTQGIGSAVVLNALLWLALVISIPLAGFKPAYVAVALVSVLLLLIFGVLVYLLTRGEDHLTSLLVVIARRVRFLHEDAMQELVRRLGERLRDLLANQQLLWRAAAWAAANWLLDAASLWAFVSAFGRIVDPIDLFVAYGVAMVLAAIPITPGGLGVVETSATLLLASFGVPKGVALFGVLGWRLIEFWLPIPVGAGTYISLRMKPGSRIRGGRKVLSELTSKDPHPREPHGAATPSMLPAGPGSKELSPPSPPAS